MLLEIELHQAFGRVCSYVSSIYLPRGCSLLLIVSGVYFKNHFSYWMQALCFSSARWESGVPSDRSLLLGEAHACVCACLYTRVCVGAWDCLEWKNDSVATTRSWCGFACVFSMRERRMSINSTCFLAVCCAAVKHLHYLNALDWRFYPKQLEHLHC